MKTVSKKKQKKLEQAVAAPSTSSPTTAAISAPFGVLNASRAKPKVVSMEELIQRYTECENMDKCIDTGLHILHFPSAWADFYSRQNPGHKRALRAMIQVQTIQALLRKRYYMAPSDNQGDESAESALLKVALDGKQILAPAFSSVQYPSDYAYQSLKKSHKRLETEIRVLSGDCLEAAFALQSRSNSEPLVLDMASMSMPGGGWRKASAAQEENLHRRTNLLHCLEDPYRVNPSRAWDYPIPQFGGIYIPGVTVFRGSEPNGYPFLEVPFKVSIVASAALKMPPTETDPHTGEEILDRKLAKETLRKIEAILSIAAEHGHTALVLSAYGCGAYMNPPGHIARLFHKAINSSTFKGRFQYIHFAILDSQAELPTSDTDSPTAAPPTPTNEIPSSSSQSSPNNAELPSKAKTHKAITFAKAFGVDVCDLDGSVLYKVNHSKK